MKKYLSLILACLIFFGLGYSLKSPEKITEVKEIEVIKEVEREIDENEYEIFRLNQLKLMARACSYSAEFSDVYGYLEAYEEALTSIGVDDYPKASEQGDYSEMQVDGLRFWNEECFAGDSDLWEIPTY